MFFWSTLDQDWWGRQCPIDSNNHWPLRCFNGHYHTTIVWLRMLHYKTSSTAFALWHCCYDIIKDIWTMQADCFCDSHSRDVRSFCLRRSVFPSLPRWSMQHDTLVVTSATLVVTGATLVVTSALLVVTRSDVAVGSHRKEDRRYTWSMMRILACTIEDFGWIRPFLNSGVGKLDTSIWVQRPSTTCKVCCRFTVYDSVCILYTIYNIYMDTFFRPIVAYNIL